MESPRRSFYAARVACTAVGKVLSTSISYTAGVSLPRFTDVPTRGQICAEAPKLVPTLPQTMFAARDPIAIMHGAFECRVSGTNEKR